MILLDDAWCPGRPRTKGSLDFVPGPRCRCSPQCKGHLPAGARARENVAGSGQWRQLMASRFAQLRVLPDAWPGPVAVYAVFWLPVVDVTAARSGDIDKLMRNVLDALTDAKIYEDDVQVVRSMGDKAEANARRGPGVMVRVESRGDQRSMA